MTIRKAYISSFYKQEKLSGKFLSDGSYDCSSKIASCPQIVNDLEVYKIDNSILVPMVLNTSTDSSLEAIIATRLLCTETLTGFVSYVIITAAKLKAQCKCRALKVPQSPRYDDVTYVSSIRHKMPEERITDSFVPFISNSTFQLSVVMIGCGSVGSVIVSKILSSNIIHPTLLYLMTRQPDALWKFAACGVRCGTISVEAVKKADVIIIATQPGQLQTVCKQIKGHITSSTIVVSLCVGVPVEKVCALLEHPLTLSSDFIDMNRLSVIAKDIIVSKNISDIIDCVLPFSSAFLTEKCDDSSVVSSSSLCALFTVLDQIAFVLTSSATLQGMSYTDATFVVWGCLTTQDFRNTWTTTTFREDIFPNAEDTTTICTTLDRKNSLPNSNIKSPISGLDALRYDFSGCKKFCSLVGASEVLLLQAVREKLHMVIEGTGLLS